MNTMKPGTRVIVRVGDHDWLPGVIEAPPADEGAAAYCKVTLDAELVFPVWRVERVPEAHNGESS